MPPEPASTGEDEPELRRIRGDADVGRKRHRHPHACGRAVDRRDHGLERPVDPQSDTSAQIRRCPTRLGVVAEDERVSPGREIGTGAEPPPRSGDDDGAHVVVGIRLVEQCDEPFTHLVGERVEAIGAVQSYHGNLAVTFENYRVLGTGLGHGGSFPGSSERRLSGPCRIDRRRPCTRIGSPSSTACHWGAAAGARRGSRRSAEPCSPP